VWESEVASGKLTNWLLGILAALIAAGILGGLEMRSDFKVMRRELELLREDVITANAERWPKSDATLAQKRQDIINDNLLVADAMCDRRLDEVEKYLERLKERDRLGKDFP
jgi:hypothetical protein